MLYCPTLLHRCSTIQWHNFYTCIRQQGTPVVVTKWHAYIAISHVVLPWHCNVSYIKWNRYSLGSCSNRSAHLGIWASHMIQRVCICSKQHILKTLKTNILWGTNSGHMGIVFGGTLQMTGNYHKGVSSAALLRMVRSTSNKFFKHNVEMKVAGIKCVSCVN